MTITEITTTSPEWQSIELVTVGEMALTLKVSRMTVYRLIEKGQVRSIRIGRSVRIPAAELERLAGGSDA